MPEYKAPLRDMQVVMHDVLDSEALYQSLPGFEEATAEFLFLFNRFITGFHLREFC